MTPVKLIEFVLLSGGKICLNVSYIVSVQSCGDDITCIAIGAGMDEYWEVKVSYDDIKYHLQLNNVEIWELPKPRSEV